MNDSDFAQWMRARGYRDSTVTYTLREVRRARAHWDRRGELLESVEGSLRRLATYLRETTPPDLGALEQAVHDDPDFLPVREMRKAPRRRKRPAKSFAPDDWERLQAAVADDGTPEGIVLRLLCATGHRVGDLLRIPRSALASARKTGVLLLERKGGDVIEVPLSGAQRSWDALWSAWKGGPDDLVADWVCPDCSGGPEAGGGAYKRVQRHLYRVGERIGLDGRVHLHRLRRTVGVRALKLTRDVHLVSQLLGHRTLSATEGYVDEMRRDEVSQLQRRLRGEDDTEDP